ncbi:P-loop NTPase family protein [Paenibacillus massiliensis]|uniref:AAA family ATPase n=1 Tax=Paenibacillus massiliensis TaxID=225917 RepID=UPI000361CD08|nr:AAA family ATPase [Paenibacillus massiliensis]
MSITAVLATENREYIEPLLDYLHGSEYSRQLRITAFSQSESFAQFMEESSLNRRLPDVVVAEQAFLDSWSGYTDCEQPLLLLSEHGATMDGRTGIAMYQPLPRLLEKILDAGRLQAAVASRRNREGTLTIGLISASGGTGKTTTALNMVKQLGGAGYSVFYLNLETLDSSSLFHDQGEAAGRGLSRLLYDLRSGKDGRHKQNSTILPIQEYAMRHSVLKADVFAPLANRKEVLEMDAQETSALIQAIVDGGRYDVLVIDASTELNGRLQGVLDRTDELIWLLNDELLSMHKCMLWLELLHKEYSSAYESWMSKVHFVVNRYMGELANTPPALIKLSGSLPYIPSWKQMQLDELLLSSPIFQREVRLLCGAILGDEL